MSEDNMSAEQAPHSQEEADQHEPQDEFAGWQPTSQLVSEVGPSFEQNINFAVAHPKSPKVPKGVGGVPPLGGQEQKRGQERHWGRKIALGAAGLLAAAGIVSRVDRAINSEDDNSESGVAPLVTPNTEPTKIPAVEEVDPANATESPYEFGFSQEVGEVTVQLTKQIQERTECPDPDKPIKTANMVSCYPIHEIVVNKDIFPNAEALLKEEFEMGIYLAWQHSGEGRTNVTYEEYMERVNSGEDMSIKARGFKGASFLPSEITISPKDKFFYDMIHEPASIIRPWTSLGVGYRSVKNEEGENEFHLEIYMYYGEKSGEKPEDMANYVPGNLIALGLTFLSFPELQKQGSFFTQAQVDSLAPVVVPLRNLVLKRVNDAPYAILGAK